MRRLDENGSAADGAGEPTREALEARVRDLEEENRHLWARIEKIEQEWDLDRQSLEWYYSLGMPQTEAEMLEQARTGLSIGDVLAECDPESGK
jgi:hypothetical protein